MSETTKPCPFCAETIQAAAVVCRFCGRELAKPAPHKIRNGGAYQCSECKGYVRPEAIQCKHCHAIFGVETAERPAAFVPPPAKKPNTTAIVLTVVVALIVVAVFLFGGSGSRSAPRTASTYSIVYRVKGTTSFANMTYQNAQGGTEQTEKHIPWEVSFNARPGVFLYLSAQNSMQTGSVTCEILVDGTVVKTSTSDGGYKIASCSGTL